jgi:site-specific recombinase XerC
MSTPEASAKRVTGHLKLIERREGPVWYAKTRVPGRTPEQTTKRLAPAHLTGGKPPAGHLTRRQAEDRLADLLTEERRKVGQRAYDHLPATFGDASAGFLRHIEHVRGRERSTLHDYRSSIRNYLDPAGATRRSTPSPPPTLRTSATSSYRPTSHHAPWCDTSLSRTASSSTPCASTASSATPRPPTSSTRPNVNYSGEFRTLDAEQLASLIRHAASEQDAVLYLAAAHSGLRQGELRALRWRDIDFAADRIHVRHSARIGAADGVKAPKSGRVRSVPMVPQLAGALAKLGQREHFTGDEDLVFGNAVGEVEHDNLLRRRYYRALNAAGLPRVRFHDLRHVFGSTAVKAFPLSDVQAMLGHAHITTTMRYVHHRPGKDDAQRLAAAFEGDSVSPLVSGNGDTEGNSAQLSDTDLAY